MNRLVRRFNRKLKSNGLFTFLAVISVLGFAFQGVRSFWGVDVTFGGFAWTSVLLGLGLMVESKIGVVLKHGNKNEIAKLITFMVGGVVFLGGLSTVPFVTGLGLGLVGGWASIVGVANVIAIVVILYELFIID